jgi:hypothetical protein
VKNRTLRMFSNAIMLHHQQNLQGAAKADYKRKVVERLYGSLSYSGLAKERKIMMYEGSNVLANPPEKWIPDPAQRRRAMALVAAQFTLAPDGSTEVITCDAFDALCDEFITAK